MIKTFEQFTADKYGKPVNEAYQSSKLREIIKQHGKPKWSFEYKMLYDIKDDEIIDVLDNRDEYWKKYSNRRKDSDDKSEATFMLELEDGACVVISNLGILKDFYGADPEKKFKEVFKQRHSERHVGNSGKIYPHQLDIRKKHRENVDKLLSKRLLKKIESNMDEFIEKIKSIWDNMDMPDFDKHSETNEDYYEFTVGDEEYGITITYEYGCRSLGVRHGAEEVECHINLENFEITDEDGGTVSSDDLDIPQDVLNYFSNEWRDEGGITDYYEYYGVSPSDFFSGM